MKVDTRGVIPKDSRVKGGSNTITTVANTNLTETKNHYDPARVVMEITSQFLLSDKSSNELFLMFEKHGVKKYETK
jgi:hypothetical protein